MKHTLLFIGTHRRDRSPSQRYRFEQFCAFFEKNGYQITYSSILNEADDKIFYSKGYIIKKSILAIKGILIRLMDFARIGRYDIVFISRLSFLFETALFEKLIKKRNAKIIYDFDDAIWLPNSSEANKNLAWLKRPDKIKEIIQLANVVIAGNDYLNAYAGKFTNETIIIPTSVDTNWYSRLPNNKLSQKEKIIIGWSGSITTIQHFQLALPFIKKLKEKYKNIEINVIGDSSYYNKETGIKGIEWSYEKEVELLSNFDIGIMPLPDDEWSKGKCGLKGLLYMSMEIPAVMSPVGVNTEIIQDGVNGFLAANEDEWVQKLSLLIESAELRIKLGEAGRKTVVEKYSVEANKEKYLELFKKVISTPKEN